MFDLSHADQRCSQEDSGSCLASFLKQVAGTMGGLDAGVRHAAAIVGLRASVKISCEDNRRDEHAVSSSTRRFKNCFVKCYA